MIYIITGKSLPFLHEPRLNIVQEVILYLIVILLILSGTVMWNYIPGIAFFDIGLLGSMAFMMLEIILITRQFGVKSIISASVVLAYLLLYVVILRDHPHYTITHYVLPFIIYIFFTCEMTRKGYINNFLHAISNVIIILAGISIFCWVFGSVLGLLPGRRAMSYYFAEQNLPTYSYFNLYFENPVQAQHLGGMVIPRNTGFAPEAPGFSSHLIYPFVLETLYFQQKSKIKISILILALITSMSTKGLFFLMCFVLMKYLFSIKSGSTWKKILKILFAVVLFILALYLSNIIIEDKSETASYSIRVDDVRAELLTWMDHPIFGIGIYQYWEIISKFRVYRNNNGLSMGLTCFMAQGGLYLVFLYFFPSMYFLFAKKEKTTKQNIIIAFTLITMDLVISTIHSSARFILVIAVIYALMIYDRQRSSMSWNKALNILFNNKK